MHLLGLVLSPYTSETKKDTEMHTGQMFWHHETGIERNSWTNRVGKDFFVGYPGCEEGRKVFIFFITSELHIFINHFVYLIILLLTFTQQWWIFWPESWKTCKKSWKTCKKSWKTYKKSWKTCKKSCLFTCPIFCGVFAILRLLNQLSLRLLRIVKLLKLDS